MTDLGDPFEAVDPRREALRAWARAEAARRLIRTEQVLEECGPTELEGLCNWLGGMMHRPPLERPTPAYRPMRALVEALWWDLADRTPDPLEPNALSPRIIDEHPWGEGTDA